MDSLTPPPVETSSSFAARVSLTVAIAGFALFWGVVVMVAVMPWDYKPTGLAMAWALLIAVTLHFVGLGVIWAAPKGKRMVGLIANTVALLMLVALVAVSLSD